jgi:hypothetical protein
MRQFLIILTIYVFVSCDRSAEIKLKEPLKFYYFTYSHYTKDPDSLNKIYWHNSQDSLLASAFFETDGISHKIRMFTSDFYSDIDGGGLSYELDSIGIIYDRSTTWHSYGRLHTNSDSLNAIIEVALENIILQQSLHCYQCQDYYDRKPIYQK